MPEKRVRVLVSGRVQGVFFRLSTQEAARRLGCTGWVRNLHDGRVEALIEGSGDAVDHMIDWCRNGPPGARVDDLEITTAESSGEFEDFLLRY